MTKNSNSDHDERGLLPFPVIIAATKGDPDAMKIVLSHYEGDMLTLSVRKMRDERGNTYYGTDQDIYDRLRSRLIRRYWISRSDISPCLRSPFRKHGMFDLF